MKINFNSNRMESLPVGPPSAFRPRERRDSTFSRLLKLFLLFHRSSANLEALPSVSAFKNYLRKYFRSQLKTFRIIPLICPYHRLVKLLCISEPETSGRTKNWPESKHKDCENEKLPLKRKFDRMQLIDKVLQ